MGDGEIRPNSTPIRTKLTKLQSGPILLFLDDIRSSRSTQGRRPKVNDYEDVDIDISPKESNKKVICCIFVLYLVLYNIDFNTVLDG
jgi:hypothetical protein